MKIYVSYNIDVGKGYLFHDRCGDLAFFCHPIDARKIYLGQIKFSEDVFLSDEQWKNMKYQPPEKWGDADALFQ